MQKYDVKKSQQNIVFVEQQIYTSQENFTPTVLVMIVTFRRSQNGISLRIECHSKWNVTKNGMSL